MNKLVLNQTIDTTMIQNNAGGQAYSLTAKQSLAQFACTGCLTNTYYVSDRDQLQTLQTLLPQVDPEFIAKLAIYSRQSAYMKDMPAMLLAYLASIRSDFFPQIFSEVIENTKMLRNFVQIIRSGVFGRKSFGTRIKRVIQNWLDQKSDEFLFRGSIGQNPTLGDVIRLTHPNPKTDSRKALYGYLTQAMTVSERDYFVACEKNAHKKPNCYDPALLPTLVQEYEAFRANPSIALAPPNVSFEMLSNLNLSPEHWATIARKSSWTQTRMNLNTFQRHKVFDQDGMVQCLTEKLADPELIKKSKVFPYQLFTAYQNLGTDVPDLIKAALHVAMEISTQNVPALRGSVVVCPDVSGSMSNPITGSRQMSSKTRCIDVAALITSCLVRNNPDTLVLPFDTALHQIKLESEMPVLDNAARLAKFGGGGTDCTLPLTHLNKQNIKANSVIYISDNESHQHQARHGVTSTDLLWKQFCQNNPEAKLVLIDLTPSQTAQVRNESNVLSIGGWSDQTFEVMANFLEGNRTDHWVDSIEAIQL